MRMNYKVIRNLDNKIIDRIFIIEKSCNSSAECEKLERIYKHLSKKYFVSGDYGVISISYTDNLERKLISKTVDEFTTNIKRLYKEGKENIEVKQIKETYIQVTSTDHPINKTEHKTKNNLKLVRRRNRQIIKACILYNHTINEMREKDFDKYDNSSLNIHLLNHSPLYYYKSFAQYRSAKKYYHFSKYHTKYFPAIG